MTLPLRPVGAPARRRTRPVRTRRRTAGVRLVRYSTALVLAFGLAACGGGADVAGDDPVVAEPAGEDRDGDAARCLPDAVDCDDTPGGDEPAGDGDAMVPEDITIVDALPEGTPSVEMAPGSSDEPFRIFIQEAVVDGTDLRVSFNGGETPCFVVDHTEVHEDDQQVIVSVFVSVPDPGADCSNQRMFLQSVPVQLDAPLGDRALKDGSRTVIPEAQS